MCGITGVYAFNEKGLKYYRLSVDGNVSIRLFEGFSFDVSGGYTRINDQLSLRKGNLSNEEVMAARQERATSYDYYTSFGITYSFGSIYSNVVNSRFGTGF